MQVAEKVFVLFVYKNSYFVLGNKNNKFVLPFFTNNSSALLDQFIISTANDKLGSYKKPFLLSSTKFFKRLFEAQIEGIRMIYCAKIFDYEIETIRKNNLFMLDLDIINFSSKSMDDFAKTIINEYMLEINGSHFLSSILVKKRE